MSYVWWILAAWNLTALAVGVVGLFRPHRRKALAAIVGQQARAAVWLSVASLVIGVPVALLAVALASAGSSGSLLHAGAFFAAAFWAAGGVVPFMTSIFLAAEPRRRVRNTGDAKADG